MAILATLATHPSSDIVNPRLYGFIDIMQYSRLKGTLSLGMVYFASLRERAAYKASMADWHECFGRLNELAELHGRARPMLPSNTPDVEAAKALDDEREATIDEFEKCKRRMGKAENVIGRDGNPGSVSGVVPMIGCVIHVPTKDVSSMLDDSGRPDLEKCYAFLMTHPLLAAAGDAPEKA